MDGRQTDDTVSVSHSQSRFITWLNASGLNLSNRLWLQNIRQVPVMAAPKASSLEASFPESRVRKLPLEVRLPCCVRTGRAPAAEIQIEIL